MNYLEYVHEYEDEEDEGAINQDVWYAVKPSPSKTVFKNSREEQFWPETWMIGTGTTNFIPIWSKEEIQGLRGILDLLEKELERESALKEGDGGVGV